MRVNASFERFADGSFECRRIRGDGDVEYGRQPVAEGRNGPATTKSLSGPLVCQYLNTTECRVTRIGNDSESRYRIVATGQPLGPDHAVRDYGATAVVGADGFVTSLRVSCLHPDTRTPVRVTAEYRLACAAGVPGWYDEARTHVRRQPCPAAVSFPVRRGERLTGLFAFGFCRRERLAT